MPQLSQILSEFREGLLDQGQLLARSAELLSESGTNVDEILSQLQEAHTNAPIALGAFVALRKHLIAAAAPKTVAMSPPRTEILGAILGTAPPKKTPSPTPSPARTAPVTSAAQQAIGAVLAGRFRLVEFVGEGGTSRLYKAVDLRKVEAGADDPHVAVKILTLPIQDTLEALAILHRETAGLQTLAHPNIVRVIDCDRDGDTVFMTMEFIRGKTLHALLRGSKFAGSGRDDAWRVIQAIAAAAEFAHSKSIVHGDLTPGNVMVAADGQVKVIDFGIARMFGQQRPHSEPRSASRGEITGVSPSYASPEMLEFREPDPRDDIYSLACISWELLTGARPYGKRNAKSARDEGIKLEPNDKISRKEFAALSHALNLDREQRTPSVRQFIEELTATSPKRAPRIAAAIAATVVLGVGAYYFSHFRAPAVAPSAPVAQMQKVEPVVAPAPTKAAPPAVGSVFRDCPTCPLMTVIPAGEFSQGTSSTSADAQVFEQPQHRVNIEHMFATSRTDVTVGEYAEFVETTHRESQGCTIYDGEWKSSSEVYWKNAVTGQTPSHPASCVSWHDASDYAKWLSEKTGQIYRLPSASEWEYAARAGSTTDRPWNNESDACSMGNVADQSAAKRYPGWTAFKCNDGYAQSAPVASYTANAFGLFDALGNVFVWTSDCWSETYDGAPTDGSARRDGDCTQHEMRGGSWFTAPAYVRFAYRNRFANDYRSTSIGFRIVREIAP